MSVTVISERLSSQLLAGAPARDPVSVVRHLLAVQGQDPRGQRLAIRARSTGLTAADVDSALTDDRSLLVTTLNRGTLHLVRSEDYPWLQSLTAPRMLTVCARRLAQEGPLTRGQLRERLVEAGVPTEGQALVHLIMLASLRGLIVRGPMLGREQGFVLVSDWLGAPGPVDRERALAELARRYLVGHAPAGERDLSRWSGLPLREVRSGLGAIASELEQRADGLLALRGHPPAGELPPPRLLGPFDPVLHGWVSRDEMLGASEVVVTVNGLFRPFALVRGRAVATWRMPAGEVVLEPFNPLSQRDAAALRADASEVVRYLGCTSATVKPS